MEISLTKAICCWVPPQKGTFVSSPPNEADELIKTISANTSFLYNKRDHRAGMSEVSKSTISDAKVETMGLKIKSLQAKSKKMHG